MTRDDAEEWTACREVHGNVLMRDIALGIKLKVHKALGISRDEWVDRIGVSIRSVEDRRKAVEELKAEGLSNREIADVVGVAESTVRRDKEESAPDSDRIVAQEDFSDTNAELARFKKEIQKSAKAAKSDVQRMKAELSKYTEYIDEIDFEDIHDAAFRAMGSWRSLVEEISKSINTERIKQKRGLR